MPKIYKKIFISAGDSSGDIHGANLMQSLLKKDGNIKFYGLGKEKMTQAGLCCLHDMSTKSLMWLHVLTELFAFLKMKRDCIKFFMREKPDAVILIDYCGFNFYLARAAKRIGIPVIYYVCPQLWAHGPWRVKKLKKFVDKLLVIYPFETAFYEKAGIPVTYVGHPLFDEILKTGCDSEMVAELKKSCGDTIVSILPGSRRQEIVRLLPLFLESAVRISQKIPTAKFIISCSDERYFELIDNVAKNFKVPYQIVSGKVHEVINVSSLCMVSAGTVTLQIAYYLKPMVIVYKITPFAYFIVRPFLTTPYIGLVNALANKMIVPELLVYKKSYAWLASRAIQLLEDEQKRRTCVDELKLLIARIGTPGASERAADEILKMLD